VDEFVKEYFKEDVDGRDWEQPERFKLVVWGRTGIVMSGGFYGWEWWSESESEEIYLYLVRVKI
jgi:hypothetical protein